MKLFLLELIYLYYKIEIVNLLYGFYILFVYVMIILKWLLIINIFYDCLFLFNFLNKNMVKIVLYLYYFLIGYYEIFCFNMVSLRLWKFILLLNIFFKLEEFINYKFMLRCNYYYIFKWELEDILRKEERIYRVFDD